MKSSSFKNLATLCSVKHAIIIVGTLSVIMRILDCRIGNLCLTCPNTRSIMTLSLVCSRLYDICSDVSGCLKGVINHGVRGYASSPSNIAPHWFAARRSWISELRQILASWTDPIQRQSTLVNFSNPLHVACTLNVVTPLRFTYSSLKRFGRLIATWVQSTAPMAEGKTYLFFQIFFSCSNSSAQCGNLMNCFDLSAIFLATNQIVFDTVVWWIPKSSPTPTLKKDD